METGPGWDVDGTRYLPGGPDAIRPQALFVLCQDRDGGKQMLV